MGRGGGGGEEGEGMKKERGEGKGTRRKEKREGQMRGKKGKAELETKFNNLSDERLSTSILVGCSSMLSATIVGIQLNVYPIDTKHAH